MSKLLVKAVLNVMKAVDSINKNSKVGAGRNQYKGVRDLDVKVTFKKAMQENGLIMIPIDVDETTVINRWEESYNGQAKQKQSIFTKAVVTYKLMHESGESEILKGYGHGVDSQDKGAGKAMTYALKYTLLYTFMTPVGDIDDSDSTHSDDIKMREEDARCKLEQAASDAEEAKRNANRLLAAAKKRLLDCETTAALQKEFLALTAEYKTLLVGTKDEMKTKLTPKKEA